MGIGGFGQGPAPKAFPKLLCFMSKESTLHRYEIFELSIYSSRVASRFGISADFLHWMDFDGAASSPWTRELAAILKRKGSWEEDFPLL